MIAAFYLVVQLNGGATADFVYQVPFKDRETCEVSATYFQKTNDSIRTISCVKTGY